MPAHQNGHRYFFSDDIREENVPRSLQGNQEHFFQGNPNPRKDHYRKEPHNPCLYSSMFNYQFENILLKMASVTVLRILSIRLDSACGKL